MAHSTCCYGNASLDVKEMSEKGGKNDWKYPNERTKIWNKQENIKITEMQQQNKSHKEKAV